MLLILITYLSIYFSFEARASEAEPQVESSSKPVTPDSKPVTPEKKITIQIGAFTSLRKAALMRSILKPMGPVQVEKIRTEREETLYRVLIGEFKTLQDAKTYVQKHHLKELFQNVWVNPVALEPGEGKEVIPNEVLDQDPYFVHVELNCEEKKHYGAYNFELQPSEGDSNKDIEVTLNWNCIADNRERWLAKDEQRSPSHISLTPLLGAGSLTMNDSVLGSMNRFDFSYGVQVTGFRSFGGIGPTFEY